MTDEGGHVRAAATAAAAASPFAIPTRVLWPEQFLSYYLPTHGQHITSITRILMMVYGSDAAVSLRECQKYCLPRFTSYRFLKNPVIYFLGLGCLLMSFMCYF